MVPSISPPTLSSLNSLGSLGSWLVRDIASAQRPIGLSVAKWIAITLFVLATLAAPTIVFAVAG